MYLTKVFGVFFLNNLFYFFFFFLDFLLLQKGDGSPPCTSLLSLPLFLLAWNPYFPQPYNHFLSCWWFCLTNRPKYVIWGMCVYEPNTQTVVFEPFWPGPGPGSV